MNQKTSKLIKSLAKIKKFTRKQYRIMKKSWKQMTRAQRHLMRDEMGKIVKIGKIQSKQNKMEKG